MFKIMLVILALSYTFGEDSNKSVQKQVEDVSKIKWANKINYRYKKETTDEDYEETNDNKDSITDNPKDNSDDTLKHKFDFKDFLTQIKEDVMKYSKKLKQKRLSQEQLKVITNTFVDKVIAKLRIMIDFDLNPLSLPDHEEVFEYNVGLFMVTGNLQLSHGNLTNLRRIARAKSVEILERGNIRVKIPLHIDQMEFEFDYSAKLLGYGPTGKVVGTVRNSKAALELVVSPKTRMITKAEFNIEDRGKILFDLEGGIVNQILNMMKRVIGFVVDKILLSVLDNFIKNELAVFVDDVNEMVQEIIEIT